MRQPGGESRHEKNNVPEPQCCRWPRFASAAELSGVFVEDEIKALTGETLVLNGIGLREKFWVDVYVGSLYLPARSDDVAEILSGPDPGAFSSILSTRKSPDKLLEAWREGFEKNQNEETLEQLQSRIDQFYGYFDRSVPRKGALRVRLPARPGRPGHAQRQGARH